MSREIASYQEDVEKLTMELMVFIDKYGDENIKLREYIIELEGKIELLSKPEKQPLTDDELEEAFKNCDDGFRIGAFIQGVKFAEQYHGITK